MWHRVCYWLGNFQPLTTLAGLVRDFWACLQLVPWSLSLAAMAVLQVGQLREVYLISIESETWWHFLFGLFLTFLLAVLLHSINLHLAHTSGARDPDIGVIRMRFISAAICGGFPLLGVSLGIGLALHDVKKNTESFATASGVSASEPVQRISLPGGRQQTFIDIILETFPYLLVSLVALVIYVACAWLAYRAQRAEWRWSAWWTVGIILALSALVSLAVVFVMPSMSPAALLEWSKWAGPFAMTALQLMLVSGIVWSLIYFSRYTGWPVVLILLVAVAYFNWGTVGEEPGEVEGKQGLIGLAMQAAGLLFLLMLAIVAAVLATRLVEMAERSEWRRGARRALLSLIWLTGLVALGAAIATWLPGAVQASPWSRSAVTFATQVLPILLPMTLILSLAWASGGSGWPVVAIAPVVMAGLFWISSGPATESDKRIAAEPTDHPQPKATPAELLVENVFEKWLVARRKACAWPNEEPFPVLIVAVQGGGIYASSSASAFLAGQLAANPRFNNHVFAISGVSGGSVGAALYHAAVAGALAKPDADCPKPGDKISLDVPETLRKVVTEDHLSPVLALVGADYLHKIFIEWWAGKATNRLRREGVLEASLACSLWEAEQARAKKPKTRCDPTAIKESKVGLNKRFADHFAPDRALPALVLNTTSAESGRRVAFAPFALQHIGEGSLMSFTDRFFAGRVSADTTIIQAAVASARFPGLMPALTLTERSSKDKKRWNFVDGGFADNSGVATAAAIVQALRSKEDVPGYPKFKIGLIVLTDESNEPNYDKLFGTGLTDTRAQIDTLLHVRSGIASRETYLANERFKDKNAKRVWIVQIDQSNFTLQLGWTISRTTNSMMALIAGLDATGNPTKNKSLLEKNRDEIGGMRSFLAQPEIEAK